jgi:hypothetical protein
MKAIRCANKIAAANIALRAGDMQGTNGVVAKTALKPETASAWNRDGDKGGFWDSAERAGNTLSGMI